MWRVSVVSEVSAPWFEVALVEGVGLRAYLENDGVYAKLFEAVELGDYVLFVLLGCLVVVLSLVYCVEPCSSKFAFRVLCPCCGGGEYCEHGEY